MFIWITHTIDSATNPFSNSLWQSHYVWLQMQKCHEKSDTSSAYGTYGMHFCLLIYISRFFVLHKLSTFCSASFPSEMKMDGCIFPSAHLITNWQSCYCSTISMKCSFYAKPNNVLQCSSHSASVCVCRGDFCLESWRRWFECVWKTPKINRPTNNIWKCRSVHFFNFVKGFDAILYVELR